MLNPLKMLLLLLVFFVSIAVIPFTRSFKESGNPVIPVWVNKNSGIYHCPRTRWYGRTKEGEFMSQRWAQWRGHRPAYGSDGDY